MTDTDVSNATIVDSPGNHSPYTPEKQSPPMPVASHAAPRAETTIAASTPAVKGTIDIADEVVEKVAALAAYEVEGVADLGGDVARAFESLRDKVGLGEKRGNQGVKATMNGNEVTVNVTVMAEYGYVIMDVAKAVQANVSIQTNRMLGLKVVEVNVLVDDVKMPPDVDDRLGERKHAETDGA